MCWVSLCVIACMVEPCMATSTNKGFEMTCCNKLVLDFFQQFAANLQDNKLFDNQVFIYS